MKKLFIAVVALSLLPAFAMAQETPKPAETAKPPVCGKTVEECQKKVDDQAADIARLSAGLEGARQQRNAAQASFEDLVLQQHIEQATAKK